MCLVVSGDTSTHQVQARVEWAPLHRQQFPPGGLRGTSRGAGLCAGGRITAVAACHDGQSVASGSSAGSIHIWRVEYTSRVGGAPDRYTGVTHTRKVTGGTTSLHYTALFSPVGGGPVQHLLATWMRSRGAALGQPRQVLVLPTVHVHHVLNQVLPRV